ncbi:MAG: Glycosyl transferase, group 2 family, partial [uncultured bacterium]
MAKSLSVSIVIPNWNGVGLMKKHLPRVIAFSEGAEIIVADDASSDESVEMLRNKFPSIRVVANKKRQGFAGNVNSG